MIVNLTPISLAGKGSGYSQRVDLSIVDSYRAIAGEENRRGWLLLQNRSGTGLEIDMSGGRSFRILDGQDQRLHLKPEDEAYTFIVLYVLSNPSLTTLYGTFFSEDDAQDLASGASSSIGLAGVAVSQVINDGNTAPTTVLEATPSGGSSSAKIVNDGSGYLSGGLITYDSAGNESHAVAKRINLDGLSGTTSAAAFLGAQVFGAASPLELYRVGDRIYMGSDNGIVAKVGSYNDGTDKFLGTGAAFEWWYSALTPGLLSWRQSTNAPSAGTAITYGPVMLIPAVVAQTLNQSISVTTLTTILSYTPPAAGWYRVSAIVEIAGTAGAHTVTVGISYTDQFLGSSLGYNFAARTGGATITNLNAASITSPTALTTFSETIHAATSAPIIVNYQNATATVNDNISALIERIG